MDYGIKKTDVKNLLLPKPKHSVDFDRCKNKEKKHNKKMGTGLDTGCYCPHLPAGE